MRTRLLAGGGLLVALVWWISGSAFWSYVLSVTFVFAIWAAGMNLLAGYTGQLPLMYGGLAGFGAYTWNFLVQDLGWSPWASVGPAVVAAAFVGALLGLPALRLQGFYFTLSSLVVQSALTLFYIVATPFTRGDIGLSTPTTLWLLGRPLKGRAMAVFLLWLLVVITALLAWLVRSRPGVFFQAIRDDEVLAGSLGIDVTRYKLLSFTIASAIAGFGGILFLQLVGYVSPRSFDVLLSLTIWLMVGLGGRGTIVGPLLGAAILAPLPYALQAVYPLRDVIYGLLVIFTMMVMPTGIVGALQGGLPKPIRLPWARLPVGGVAGRKEAL